MRSALARAAVAAGIALAASGLSARAQDVPSPAWTEIAWPFLRDGWPSGRAFECEGAACGEKLTLYARVKNGFCDCTRGVSDDDEIDRVSDIDLITPFFRPVAPGDPAPLAGMAGRTRLYETLEHGHRKVLSLAGGRDCNAFVAMALGGDAFPPGGAEAVAAFINSPDFSHWVADKQSGK